MNKYYMGTYILYIGLTLIFLCCGVVCGFICNIPLFRTIFRVPLSCCICIFIVLMLLYGAVLITIYRLGYGIVDNVCGTGDSGQIIPEETVSGI